jgi:hypothetical protein
MSAFPDFIRFTSAKFNHIKQLTEKDYRAIIQQLIIVMAFFITESCPTAIHFIRIITNFIIFAEYRSHNDETLQYIQFYIHRINQLKEVFRVVQFINKNTGENQFNFPKFYILIYYPEFIKFYNCANNIDTEISKMKYRLIIKQSYDRTNKKDNFLK